MLRFSYDLFRAAVATLAIMSSPSLLGQTVPPAVASQAAAPSARTDTQGGGDMNPSDQISLIQWGLREGGAFAVILVILFFYRRDWKTAVEFWRDQHAITTKLVQDNTVAQTETAAALRENTVVVHQAKNVLARMEQRRDGGT